MPETDIPGGGYTENGVVRLDRRTLDNIPHTVVADGDAAPVGRSSADLRGA